MRRTRDAPPRRGPTRSPAHARPARRRCIRRTGRENRSAARLPDRAHPEWRSDRRRRDAPRWNAVSKQATCGRPGNRSASAFSTAIAGGLCSGASGDTASIRASVAASTTHGRGQRPGRHARPDGRSRPAPARSAVRRAAAARAASASAWSARRQRCFTRRRAVGRGDQQASRPADALYRAGQRAGQRPAGGRPNTMRISGLMTRRSAHTGSVVSFLLAFSGPCWHAPVRSYRSIGDSLP